MSFSNLISKAKSWTLNTATYLMGWKTNRKIIVIESDDWGMVRTTSRKAYDFLLRKGYPVDQDPYSKYDALESEKDLESIFEVLQEIKDKNGNHPVITANNILANPDFQKIKDHEYESYYFEDFNISLSKLKGSENVPNLYGEGIKRNIFFPQFHGREHINVINWLNALQHRDKDALLAFDLGMISCHRNGLYCKGKFFDAFGNGDENSIAFQKQAIKEGLQLFSNIYGFKAKSFIAPCYSWSPLLYNELKQQGVQYIQGNAIQIIPGANFKKGYKTKFHYTGQKNNLSQYFIVRNALFEPSIFQNSDMVNSCMNDIHKAFRKNTPAIIGCHRLNFIGRIFEDNRVNNLRSLSALLSKIKKTWPDVEFMSTQALGDLISSEEKKQ